jgi:hypothetical protein
MTIEILTSLIDPRVSLYDVDDIYKKYKRVCNSEDAQPLGYFYFCKGMLENGYVLSHGAKQWLKKV